MHRSSTQAEGDMQVFRLAAITLSLATLSLAQNVIDTRDKPYREISGHQARGGGGGGDQKYLRGVFTIPDPTNLTPGSRFDYELVVTNNQNVPIAIPQTLDWKEIDQGRVSQNFVRATLSVHMGCLEHDEVGPDRGSGVMDNVVLYGSDERPGTEIMLGPGESVPILGSGLMPLHWSMSCQSKNTSTFFANFQVNATTLQRKPEPAMPDAYSSEERLVVVANGHKEYPVTYPH
jgi:hypothetical protein